MSLTTVDVGLLSSNAQQVGFKNRIIDGGFILNQRGYVSGVSLASGNYGHDRWKGGASAGTYTFTQGALGVNTTITITAGSIIQVIEGCNLAEGGTYVLSWSGTAQGRLNGGSYGSSGTVIITGWIAGTNLNVEFNTGTLGSVQLEKGSTATSFDYRPYGTELGLCQRYYYAHTVAGSYGAIAIGAAYDANAVILNISFKQTMRISPSLIQGGGTNQYFFLRTVSNAAQFSSFTLDANYTTKDVATLTCAPSTTGGYAGAVAQAASTGFIAFSAEL